MMVHSIKPKHFDEGGEVGDGGFDFGSLMSGIFDPQSTGAIDPAQAYLSSTGGAGSEGFEAPDDPNTGFRGWMNGKHWGGITGSDYVKAGLQGLTGILAGYAAKHGQQKPIASFAKGGKVRMAEGGAAPEGAQNQAIAMNAMKALMGQSPNPQEAIQEFVAHFGQDALAQLQKQVQGQAQPATASTGGILQGPGDGMSDHIPAQVSPGEYVLDADTVSSIGNGSSEAGARKLDAARMSLRHKKYGKTSQPPRVSDKDNPILRSVGK